MEDREIVKALKEILEIMLVMGDLQKSSTISNALDLINRLQAEVERKDKIYIDLLKTSSERADIISSLQAENERLKDFATSKCADCAGCTSWKCDCANIEAEAYKECIEKVKEISKYETYYDNRLTAPIITYHITKDKLDNLLKELVGEDK